MDGWECEHNLKQENHEMAGRCCMGLPMKKVRLRPLGAESSRRQRGMVPFFISHNREESFHWRRSTEEDMESCVEIYFINTIYVHTYIHICTRAYIFI